MTTVQLLEAKESLPDLVNEVAYNGKRIILTRNGKKLAAIVSLDDLDAIEALEDKIDIASAKKADLDIKKHGTISLKQLKKRKK